MSFYLLHCVPDLEALTIWATRHRLLSPDGDDGYALHALLMAAFGEQAPKPFRYLGARQGLLAYTDQSPDALRENALIALPDIDRALGLSGLLFKAFPTTWRRGQTLAFEVRVRPIVRTKDGRERDVFLHRVESDSAPKHATENEVADLRDAIYVEWLCHHLVAEGSAEILEAGMDAFRLSRVIRRAQFDDAGLRKARAVMGPDVILKGHLKIGDSDAFCRLLKRGIGRHRAFGFGMLLVRPDSSVL